MAQTETMTKAAAASRAHRERVRNGTATRRPCPRCRENGEIQYHNRRTCPRIREGSGQSRALAENVGENRPDAQETESLADVARFLDTTTPHEHQAHSSRAIVFTELNLEEPKEATATYDAPAQASPEDIEAGAQAIGFIFGILGAKAQPRLFGEWGASAVLDEIGIIPSATAREIHLRVSSEWPAALARKYPQLCASVGSGLSIEAKAAMIAGVNIAAIVLPEAPWARWMPDTAKQPRAATPPPSDGLDGHAPESSDDDGDGAVDTNLKARTPSGLLGVADELPREGIADWSVVEPESDDVRPLPKATGNLSILGH